MKTYDGVPRNLHHPILAELCSSELTLNRSNKILIKERCVTASGFLGIITSNNNTSSKVPLIQVSQETFSSLQGSKIVHINTNGHISVLWDYASHNNGLFLTDCCDCRCLMCPQPPQAHQQETVDNALALISILDPKRITTICISGGEPTLLGDDFLKILTTIKKCLGDVPIQLLTNGKTFSDFNFTREFTKVGLSRIAICVSLHSDIESEHDLIAGAKGSFVKTVQGLYNLARFSHFIEIRHVINKINFNSLKSMAEFDYRNFPFAQHFAFMGMEITGLAVNNYENIWVSPLDFNEELDQAVLSLHRGGLNPSIYNIPLCLLKKNSWYFSRKSISDWKNYHPIQCTLCSVKDNCAGFFSTSGSFVNQDIKPIIKS